MKAIGKTPMVKEDGDTMIQVYRWTGGIKIYELRVKFGSIFKDKKGIYGDPQDIQISSKPFFMTSSLKGYTEAHAATGTTYTKLTDLGEAELSSESGEIGEDEHGPGPGADRPSGGKGRSFGPPEELKLTDDQKTKWTVASAKRSENLSGLRELSREERGAKYQEARDAFQAELKKFLTEEQMKQYEKISSERRSQWKGKGSGSGKSRPGPGEETP